MGIREYTNKLLEGIAEGIYNKDNVINAFCSYLSEDDVKDLMEINEMIDEENENGEVENE